MSSSLRGLRVLGEYVRLPATVAASALLLVGFSANVIQPVFGLTDNSGGSTAAIPAPSEPVTGYAASDQSSGYSPTPRNGGYNLTSGDSVIVRSGDTLYRISRRHGVSIASIMAANGLNSPTIKVGQRLIIPVNGPTSVAAYRKRIYHNRVPAPSRTVAYQPTISGGSYRVRTGDSLYGIARRNGVRVAALQQANSISDPTKLRVGQVLVIPAQGATYANRGPVPSLQQNERRRVAALDERSTSSDGASYGESRREPSRYDTDNDRKRSSLGGYGDDYQSGTYARDIRSFNGVSRSLRREHQRPGLGGATPGPEISATATRTRVGNAAEPRMSRNGRPTQFRKAYRDLDQELALLQRQDRIALDTIRAAIVRIGRRHGIPADELSQMYGLRLARTVGLHAGTD